MTWRHPPSPQKRCSSTGGWGSSGERKLGNAKLSARICNTPSRCRRPAVEEEVPLMHSADGEVLPRRHGQRFACRTEEASHLLQGTLEPVFRVSKSTTTKRSPSRRVVVEKDTDKPTLVRDLHTVWYWVHRAWFSADEQ